ncbi:MAG TPA: DOMON-like domain-containing protein [Allosphingosinicella sp.]|nr:DOMON-like domain-containing protein [Allosphingosinicella sp.]
MRAELIRHPDTPSGSVKRIRVGFAPSGYGPTKLEYRVFASGGLSLPPPEGAKRRDRLWETTCFELFVRPEPDDTYSEFNFSPSRAWAAYQFQSYRKGRRDLPLAAPKIDFWNDVSGCSLRAELGLIMPWAWQCRVGLSAVIEEADGTKSYWALAHPPGEPDFHHPDCFALELPPLV